MSYQHLIIERYGPVGWLINNRPDVRNAMNNAMRDEFAQAWTELNEDPSVRVIVHTGEGRDFQTGVDVGELATDGMGMERYRQSMEDFDVHFTSWHQDVWKPVITAVNGICCGGGFHWVADADIVLQRATPSFRPTRLGGPGGRHRSDRVDEEDAGRGGHAHGVHGQVRTHGCRTGASWAWSPRSSILRTTSRTSAGTRRDHREQSCGHGRNEEGSVGRPRTRAHRCLQGRRPASGVDVGSPRSERGADGLCRKRDRTGNHCRELLDLLLDHPFADDDPLVHTVAPSFTKADMVERVERYAATLDVANGSPIPVVADGIDALIAMFGCWRAGAVYVPINPRQPEAAIEKTTARTADLSAPDAAFVLWTSGTTGEPKPILHSHDAYLEIIDRVLATLRAAPVDRSALRART